MNMPHKTDSLDHECRRLRCQYDRRFVGYTLTLILFALASAAVFVCIDQLFAIMKEHRIASKDVFSIATRGADPVWLSALEVLYLRSVILNCVIVMVPLIVTCVALVTFPRRMRRLKSLLDLVERVRCEAVVGVPLPKNPSPVSD